MHLKPYPASPEVNAEPTISANFKTQAWKVVFSIIAFFIVYLLLVSSVIALAAGGFYLGILIAAAHPSWMTLLLGLGLLATSISLLIFVVKFVVSKSTDDRSGWIELRKEDQPGLFEFLQKLTKETRTSFPNKVYLSPEVNAAVIQKARFWNMFFPAKKDLVIGIGLINALNISEFKAVIAHEFGHFSQRSIRLGTFIYNVNRVIYNMLFENNGYMNFINGWANVHGLMTLFAAITVKISQFIQWILSGMYRFINKNYMALSREMEYNADDIAAFSAGGNNIISGLSKLEKADSSYNAALGNANHLLSTNHRLENIYAVQSANMQNITEVTFKSRINYRNQWASHPTIEDRRESIERLQANVSPIEISAWVIFDNANAIQQEMTNKLYSSVSFEKEPQLMNEAEYNSWLQEKIDENKFPEEYKGFYTGRYIAIKKEDLENLRPQDHGLQFDKIFTEENGQITAKMERNQADIEIADAIASKQINVKTFDFDGVKYSSAEAQNIVERLKEENESLRQEQQRLDTETLGFFFTNALDREKLKNAYQNYLLHRETTEKYIEKIAESFHILGRIREGVTLEQATVDAKRIKELQQDFTSFISNQTGNNFLSESLNIKLKAFREKSYAFFFNNQFMENEINEFSSVVEELHKELYEMQFKAYKNMLDTQLADTRI